MFSESWYLYIIVHLYCVSENFSPCFRAVLIHRSLKKRCDKHWESRTDNTLVTISNCLVSFSENFRKFFWKVWLHFVVFQIPCTLNDVSTLPKQIWFWLKGNTPPTYCICIWLCLDMVRAMYFHLEYYKAQPTVPNEFWKLSKSDQKFPIIANCCPPKVVQNCVEMT